MIKGHDARIFESWLATVDLATEIEMAREIHTVIGDRALRRAVKLGAPDAIVANLNELGGVANPLSFIRSCEAFDVGFRFHSGKTEVGSATDLQVSAAARDLRDASHILLRWYADDVIEGGPMQPMSGGLALPDGPGLGVVFYSDALERCHRRYCE